MALIYLLCANIINTMDKCKPVLISKHIIFAYLLQVQQVLKPFKVATEALSADKYPTTSAVLPLKHALLTQLNKRTPGKPEPPAVSEMKTKIITDLEKRYSEEKDAFMLLNKASYLDPRFHRLIHLKEEQRRRR